MNLLGVMRQGCVLGPLDYHSKLSQMCSMLKKNQAQDLCKVILHKRIESYSCLHEKVVEQLGATIYETRHFRRDHSYRAGLVDEGKVYL